MFISPSRSIYGGRHIKSLFPILAATLSLSAFAGREKILEVKEDGFYKLSFRFAEFELNRNKDKARVRIVINHLAPASYDDASDVDYSSMIEGLTYDPANRSISIDRDGHRYECGYFYNKPWVFDGGRSFMATGKCVFSSEKITVNVDDGWDGYQETFVKVYLDLKE